MGVQRYVTESEHKGIGGEDSSGTNGEPSLNLKPGCGDDSSTQPSTESDKDVLLDDDFCFEMKDGVEVVAGILRGELHCNVLGDCNDGEINDAMESVDANVHELCRDELACGAVGPMSVRSFFWRIYPNKSFESKDMIKSQHSDTSSLTQEKSTGLDLKLNRDGAIEGVDENSTVNTPW